MVRRKAGGQDSLRSKDKIQRVLFVLFCLEGGVFLVLVPWSGLWQKNVFLQVFKALNILFSNNFFKGAISGLGVLLLAIGFQELIGLARTSNRQ